MVVMAGTNPAMLIAFIPGICTGAAAGTEPLTAPASGAVFRIPPTGLAYGYQISPRTELRGGSEIGTCLPNAASSMPSDASL
jgi:hypothetical protein